MSVRPILVTLLALGLALPVAADESSHRSAEKKPAETKPAPDSTTVKPEEPEIHTTKLGVRYQDLVVGEGKPCKTGSTVEVHYTLWFADSTGKKLKRFQSSKDSGKPFQCRLGFRLIQGWSDGMVGMKEGGVRRLIIPPELGYGKKGMGPIPPNQWLVFEIEFLKLIRE